MNQKEIIRLAQELAQDSSNLLYAVKEEKVGYVKLLLAAGADVNALDGNIFIEAVKGYVKYGYDYKRTEEIFKLLLKAGADVNVQDGSPLIMTIEYGTCGQLQELIKAGADVNIRNGEPLLCAVTRSAFIDLEKVQMLIEAGADITAQGAKLLKGAARSEFQSDKVLDFLINELIGKKESKENE